MECAREGCGHALHIHRGSQKDRRGRRCGAKGCLCPGFVAPAAPALGHLQLGEMLHHLERDDVALATRAGLLVLDAEATRHFGLGQPW